MIRFYMVIKKFSYYWNYKYYSFLFARTQKFVAILLKLWLWDFESSMFFLILQANRDLLGFSIEFNFWLRWLTIFLLRRRSPLGSSRIWFIFKIYFLCLNTCSPLVQTFRISGVKLCLLYGLLDLNFLFCALQFRNGWN